MARALSAGPAPRRRALFGLLDADGWGWASVKAFFWFVVIIFLLGYVPDRAYYFTVSRTISLGIPAWSPINLCPPDPNENLPCPVPVGAVTPWHGSPAELALPAARTDAALLQAGRNLLLIGGREGDTATASVLVAPAVGTGNIGEWQEGPALPAPRADAGIAYLNGVVYVVGGYDESGAPTDTAFSLAPNLLTGQLGEWQTLEGGLALPEPRASASLVALADGLLLLGGVGTDGAPTATVWKTTFDRQGNLGEWTPQEDLREPVADAVALPNADHVWVIGGRDANGPTARVQRGTVGHEPSSGSGHGTVPAPVVNVEPGAVARWAVSERANLPGPRQDAMGFAANGVIYVIGGWDGSSTRQEVYWVLPVAGQDGDDIREWLHLPESNLPAPGRARAAVGQSGPNLFVVGGIAGTEPQADSLRANLSPQEPFFQLGLFGAVVPALKIDGEIGQQLGYLNAAGAGTATFVLLLLIGWMYAHPEQTRGLMERARRRRHRR